MARVAVLMTVYNAGELLRRAIDSVISQTYQDWDLLIMDDGSTDPRVDEALLDTAALRDSRIKSVKFAPTEQDRRASVRYATLLNWGAAHTTGEYLTFLCGDDYFMRDRLERMVATLDEGHSVVYGAQILLRENGQQGGLRETFGVLDDAYHLVDLNSVMVRRTAFAEVGGFPTEPSPQMWREADAWFWRRLTTAGHRFIPVPGGPTDCKTYRSESVDSRVIAGKTPW